MSWSIEVFVLFWHKTNNYCTMIVHIPLLAGFFFRIKQEESTKGHVEHFQATHIIDIGKIRRILTDIQYLKLIYKGKTVKSDWYSLPGFSWSFSSFILPIKLPSFTAKLKIKIITTNVENIFENINTECFKPIFIYICRLGCSKGLYLT